MFSGRSFCVQSFIQRSPILLIIRGIFIVGIKVLGDALKDPYGSDTEDLTVLHYITFTLGASRRIMLAQVGSRSRSYSCGSRSRCRGQ